MFFIRIALLLLLVLFIVMRGISLSVETGLTMIAIIFVAFAAMGVIGKR